MSETITDHATYAATRVRILNLAASVARDVGDEETYQHLVDLMIKIEDAYYDAGHDMELYFMAKKRGAK